MSKKAQKLTYLPLLCLKTCASNQIKTSWAKSTIFINKPVSALLKDAGNIPVDRKNKDNQKLFSGTFEVLKLNEAVAIFPEGTSYTEPRLQEIKDGASWVSFFLLAVTPLRVSSFPPFRNFSKSLLHRL